MGTDLIWQGVELMLIGMGTVFVFLTLLVLAVAAMSRAVMRWGGSAPANGAGGAAEDEIAAIAAAIAEHRRRRR